MNNQIKVLFLKPKLIERPWGGSLIKSNYYPNCNLKNVGEAWTVSGFPGISSVIDGGFLDGREFVDIIKEFPDLFNQKYPFFPILTKFLDARDNLSIQVHPEPISNNVDRFLGKNECWYVIDCPQNAQIIYGHSFATKEEFRTAIENNTFLNYIKHKKITPGMLISIPHGTLHALTAGCFVYEIQNTGDITYRLFDYNRKDINGVERDLHIEEGLNNLSFNIFNEDYLPEVEIEDTYIVKSLLDSQSFNVKIIELKKGKYSITNKPYFNGTVLEGSGFIEGYETKKGDSFVITKDTKTIKFEGTMKLIVSYMI
ncbi:MAG: class I mannose-6-phosphate isomerase [Acholeplasmatales bacterium]|jgi:mannose-6-phosphate isomerase|nr:class I mannose-6-phosphate isomerase [Acholeplasmatales bacterium]